MAQHASRAGCQRLAHVSSLVDHALTHHNTGFNITRRGDQPLTRIRIMLHPSPHDPSLVRFKLSPQLSSILDMTSATRPDAINAMWTYVRSRGLFDKADRRKVRSDEALRAVSLACFVGSDWNSQDSRSRTQICSTSISFQILSRDTLCTQSPSY